MEAGIPTVAEVPGESEVFTATLPAGQYLVALHEGGPGPLITPTDRKWASGPRARRLT